jgi:hypothetical protein
LTSIYLIPFDDIKEFLKLNKKSFKNKNDAYNVALKMLKTQNNIYYTDKITEWIIARNLLSNRIFIPNYNIHDLDFASENIKFVNNKRK